MGKSEIDTDLAIELVSRLGKPIMDMMNVYGKDDDQYAFVVAALAELIVGLEMRGFVPNLSARMLEAIIEHKEHYVVRD